MRYGLGGTLGRRPVQMGAAGVAVVASCWAGALVSASCAAPPEASPRAQAPSGSLVPTSVSSAAPATDAGAGGVAAVESAAKARAASQAPTLVALARAAAERVLTDRSAAAATLRADAEVAREALATRTLPPYMDQAAVDLRRRVEAPKLAAAEATRARAVLASLPTLGTWLAGSGCEAGMVPVWSTSPTATTSPVGGFCVDVTEVTTASFGRCVDAGTCQAPAPTAQNGELCNWGHPDKSEHPINCVSLAAAQGYCEWAHKRLPTASEWRLASRGEDGRKYPWGNDAPGDQLCWRRRVGSAASPGTCPVGAFPTGASPFGTLDMAGGVAEWLTAAHDGRSPQMCGAGSWYDEQPGWFSSSAVVPLEMLTLSPMRPAAPAAVAVAASAARPSGPPAAVGLLRGKPEQPTLGFRCAMDAPVTFGAPPATPVAVAGSRVLSVPPGDSWSGAGTSNALSTGSSAVRAEKDGTVLLAAVWASNHAGTACPAPGRELVGEVFRWTGAGFELHSVLPSPCVGADGGDSVAWATGEGGRFVRVGDQIFRVEPGTSIRLPPPPNLELRALGVRAGALAAAGIFDPDDDAKPAPPPGRPGSMGAPALPPPRLPAPAASAALAPPMPAIPAGVLAAYEKVLAAQERRRARREQGPGEMVVSHFDGRRWIVDSRRAVPPMPGGPVPKVSFPDHLSTKPTAFASWGEVDAAFVGEIAVFWWTASRGTTNFGGDYWYATGTRTFLGVTRQRGNAFEPPFVAALPATAAEPSGRSEDDGNPPEVHGAELRGGEPRLFVGRGVPERLVAYTPRGNAWAPAAAELTLNTECGLRSVQALPGTGDRWLVKCALQVHVFELRGARWVDADSVLAGPSGFDPSHPWVARTAAQPDGTVWVATPSAHPVGFGSAVTDPRVRLVRFSQGEWIPVGALVLPAL